ncbi:hypothetical protein Tco_0361004 [Tanacetum coccineum]|uniref:Uncharacterized protein n=1 Tax=Tanacetum coccineum TaxID=301880 RepID=A0ABQ5GKP9_9ASTR
MDSHATSSEVVRKSDLPAIMRQINDVLHEVVPKIAIVTTNGLMKDNLPRIVVEAVKTERAQTKAEVPALISQDDLTASISDLQHRLYVKMKNDPQSQVTGSMIWKGLKEKFEKSSDQPDTCRPEAYRMCDQDDYPNDNLEGEMQHLQNSECNRKATWGAIS